MRKIIGLWQKPRLLIFDQSYQRPSCDNSQGYIPGNVMVVSRLANAMKNEASFNQLQTFITNYSYLVNYVNEHGALGNITDIFPHWKKLSLDS